MLSIVQINQSENTYKVKAEHPLRLGQLIKFLPSEITGIVSTKEEEQNTYTVQTQSVGLNDTDANLYNWWQLANPTSSATLVNKNFFEAAFTSAELQASALNLPSNYQVGSVGWDLWYRPDLTYPWLHVLKGNDLTKPGLATHTEPKSNWPSGLWLFQSAWFYPTNLVTIATYERELTLLQPQAKIEFEYTFGRN